MKNIITLDMTMRVDIPIKFKGLSIKLLKKNNCQCERKICRQYDGSFYLGVMDYDIDNRTAQVKKEYLLPIIKELHQKFKFDNIKIIGFYELTEEEIFKEITV